MRRVLTIRAMAEEVLIVMGCGAIGYLAWAASTAIEPPRQTFHRPMQTIDRCQPPDPTRWPDARTCVANLDGYVSFRSWPCSGRGLSARLLRPSPTHGFRPSCGTPSHGPGKSWPGMAGQPRLAFDVPLARRYAVASLRVRPPLRPFSRAAATLASVRARPPLRPSNPAIQRGDPKMPSSSAGK
jgi:hypothetical protein